ncbi:Peptidyl-prolyl cis-trans isomerase Pin1 [Morus notabilis]|uniref:Peptidyl-prolyl cis-trans isomerase Pin1 n=2 Tax=Morus notabilis TaxID=981085 RepID=W9SN23_9ROSA|nr:Peptidyl-prolyl cis-trans isomerase Pin1 [Morus notabilis]
MKGLSRCEEVELSMAEDTIFTLKLWHGGEIITIDGKAEYNGGSNHVVVLDLDELSLLYVDVIVVKELGYATWGIYYVSVPGMNESKASVGGGVENEASDEDGLNRDPYKGKAVVDNEEVEEDGSDSSEDEMPYDPTICDSDYEQSEDDIVVPENVGKVFKKNDKRGKGQVVEDDGGVMIEDSDNERMKVVKCSQWAAKKNARRNVPPPNAKVDPTNVPPPKANIDPTTISSHSSQPMSTQQTPIESSDRKRKKPPPSISAADRTKSKERGSSSSAKKKTKMSSSSSGNNQVRASHILIKHQGSRRKASWKDPEGRVISNTTRDAAVSQLKSLRDDIVSGKAKFDAVASRYSDCSSAKRGGDLGPFGRGQMQKPFEEATYALKVGEISDIVDTDSGVHIIMRTA